MAENLWPPTVTFTLSAVSLLLIYFDANLISAHWPHIPSCDHLQEAQIRLLMLHSHQISQYGNYDLNVSMALEGNLILFTETWVNSALEHWIKTNLTMTLRQE